MDALSSDAGRLLDLGQRSGILAKWLAHCIRILELHHQSMECHDGKAAATSNLVKCYHSTRFITNGNYANQSSESDVQ